MLQSSATLHAISSALKTMYDTLANESLQRADDTRSVSRHLRSIEEDHWGGDRAKQTLGATWDYLSALEPVQGAIDESVTVLKGLGQRAAEIAGYMKPYEQTLADIAAWQSAGGDIDDVTATSAFQAERHLMMLNDDWIRACINLPGTLAEAIDELTSASSATVDGLPGRVPTSAEYSGLVTWFATTTGIDITTLEPDVHVPSPADLRLEELAELAFNTPGLPYSVQQSYAAEYEWLNMLHLAVTRGGYAEEQLRGAEDAYLAGAPRQFCDDLLWGLDGFSAIYGSPNEDDQNPIVELNYEIRRYVGLAIAEGRYSAEGLPDYVVVEVSAGAAGAVLGGSFVVSSSGTIFTGPALGAGTPGPGINGRAGYINPAGDDFTMEEVDAFISGVALSGSATAPPLSGGMTFPLTPFQPFSAGRSATEVGVGAYPGGDLVIAWLRPTGGTLPAWGDE